MNTRFLCCKHRAQLTGNHAAAEATWSRGIKQGRENFQNLEMDSAIACFGGAYEASEILLNGRQQNIETAYKHVMAAMFLARALDADQQPDFSQRILWKARINLDNFGDANQLGSLEKTYLEDCRHLLENCHYSLFGCQPPALQNTVTEQPSYSSPAVVH